MPFELWRQDDNGHRFLVDAFVNRNDAEVRLRDLTRNVHKQNYWICEKPEEPGNKSPQG